MKKFSFSLIELLITLIIVSLLLGAFTPLISKKLKANDITVGSFGNSSSNNGSNNNSTNVTKEYCESLNAIYVPIGPNVPKPLCVMKYNIGDVGIEDWSGIKKCEAGKDCEVKNATNEEATKENLQPACWIGTTADTACNANFGGYDGCKRTICNWVGADKLCSNIGWRLPTMPELTAFTNEIYSGKQAYESGNGNLMFCDYSDVSTSSQCKYLGNGCSGTFKGSCHPYSIWSSSFDTLSMTWCRYLVDNVWYSGARYLGNGYSARCVLDTMKNTELGQETKCYDFFCDKCKDKQFDSCTICKKGYVLHKGKCYFGTLDGCNNPTYDDTYQVVKCTSCKTGYTPCNSGSCASNEAIAKSCPANTMKIGCTCVMQYNIGDGKYTALGEDITKVKKCMAGQPCEVKNGKDPDTIARNLEPACWTGTTASTECNANFGGYGGCKRTVCNWRGGYEMCNNIGWRLPTYPELLSFTNDTYSSKEAFESGNGSLMFCDNSISLNNPLCEKLEGGCLSANIGDCYPYHLWSLSFETPSFAWIRYLGEIWREGARYLNFGFSTRCVKDL